MALKLNTLLAKVEHSTSVFKKLISEHTQFFSKKQGEFKGVKKTYVPREGMIDVPSERQFSAVVTTVAEKLDYLEQNSTEHLKNVMNIEATNASGNAKAELKVGEVSFGTYSTLELMKLKSILEKEGLEAMYTAMPTRSDAEIWNPTTDDLYKDRDIYENKKQEGIARTTEKTEYILEDPNIRHLTNPSNYTPKTSIRTIPIEIGEYTLQHFSGETTHRKRAGMLKRRSDLVEAITVAIKEANDAQVVESQFDPMKFFSYLHGE